MQDRRIAIVLPSREAVTSGVAGAVALTIGEFSRASRFRDRIRVIGGTERGDFDLHYEQIRSGVVHRLKAGWPPVKRASEAYADAVAATFRKAPPDLVEVHNQASLFVRAARVLSRKTPLCLHLHNDPQDMRGMRTAAERSALLARSALVVCVSGYIRDRFLEGLQDPVSRVVVLHNGVNLPAEDVMPKRKTILFVGRLIPEKGLDALIGALDGLAPDLPDWNVILLGQLPERHRARYGARLAQLASRWDGRFARPGFLAHSEVMREYAHAAITVVPSVWQEPFGRVALEGMAAGSAVIASRSGGLPEIIGDAGVLLPEVTPVALSNAIRALARDPDRRARLGRLARSVAAERFDVSILVRQLDGWRSSILNDAVRV